MSDRGKKIKNPIVQDGDPVLRGKARPVLTDEIGTKKLNEIVKTMSMALEREHDGVAIAAPQIGVPLRIFVVSHRAFEIEEAEKHSEDDPAFRAKDMVVINPEIVKLSKKKVKVPEGCLSVRWLYGNTMRHEKATIRALDENGKSFTYGGSGLLAQIFQHEYDHLDGILFIDHATDLERLSDEQVVEFQKQAEKNSKP